MVTHITGLDGNYAHRYNFSEMFDFFRLFLEINKCVSFVPLELRHNLLQIVMPKFLFLQLEFLVEVAEDVGLQEVE